MKKFLAVSAILAATSLQAAELQFGDLNYFFKQKQFNFGVDVQTSTYQFQNAGTKIEKEGYTALAHVNYGILDNLYVSLDANYDWKMKITGNGGSYHEDGLTSPRLGLNYRLLQQDSSGFNLDLGAFYTFTQLDDAKRGGQGKDGNAASSRDAAELNVRLGNKWNEANEFYILAGAKFNLDGEYQDKSPGGVTTEQDASTDLYLGAFYQYRPVNEFMMNIGALATQYGEIDNNEKGVGKYKTKEHLDYKFTYTAKYLVTENFIAKFNYSQSNLEDYKEDGVKVNRRHAHSIGLGVDFLF